MSSKELATFENAEIPQRWWRPMDKCKQVEKHKYTRSRHLDEENPRKNACSLVIMQALRRTWLYLRADKWSIATSDQKQESNSVQGVRRDQTRLWFDGFRITFAGDALLRDSHDVCTGSPRQGWRVISQRENWSMDIFLGEKGLLLLSISLVCQFA